VRELSATGFDVVDEAERPIAPINVFSSIGVYELKFARGKTDQVELENLALAFLHLAAQADRNDQTQLTQDDLTGQRHKQRLARGGDSRH